MSIARRNLFATGILAAYCVLWNYAAADNAAKLSTSDNPGKRYRKYDKRIVALSAKFLLCEKN